MAKFDSYGGNFAPLGYMRINEGGSHDENPNGGVQVGTDPQGVPNLLEEDETVYNDYVYSDNIYIDGGMLEKHKLPKNLNGKLYSEAADQFANEIEGMENDPIALRGFNANMVRLMNAQEEQKQIQQQKELEEELAKMSPEEIAELESQLMQMQAAEQQQAIPQEQMAVDPTMIAQQEAMAQQETPVEQAAPMQAPVQMPMMSMGGTLLRRYDMGGPEGEGDVVIVPRDATRTVFTQNAGFVPVHEFDPNSETAKMYSEGDKAVMSMIPIIGAPYIAEDVVDNWKDGHKGRAIGEGVLAGLSIIPGGGGAGSSLGFRAFGIGNRTVGQVERAANRAVRKAESSAKLAERVANRTNNAKNAKAAVATAKAEKKAAQAAVKTTADKMIADGVTDATKAEYVDALKKVSEARSALNKARASAVGAEIVRTGNNVGGVFFNPHFVTGRRAIAGEGPGLVGIGQGMLSTGVYGGLGTLVGSGVLKSSSDKKESKSTPIGEGIPFATGGRLYWPGGVLYQTPDYRVINGIPHEWSFDTGWGAGMWQQRPVGSGVRAVVNLNDAAGQYAGPFTQVGYRLFDGIPHRWSIDTGWGGAVGEGSVLSPEANSGGIVNTNYASVSSNTGGDASPSKNTETLVRTPLNPVDKVRWEIDPIYSRMRDNGYDVARQLVDRSYLKSSGLAGDNPIDDIPTASGINSDDMEVALGAPGPGNLTTIPRYAGIVGNSIFALQNALTKPTRFSMPHTPPVLPVGRLDLQPEVYNPVDMNYLQNQYAAQNTGLQRGLRNSGLGPSTGANMIAGHHAGTQNLGSALLQGWDANNQRRNSTITANNNNAKQKADFDYTLDATRAQILNNYRRLMDTDWLQLQQLNDTAETQKYQALSNQLGNVFQGLAGVGQENFSMNQLNTNPALYYRVNPDGTMSYDPRWGLLYGARGIKKEGEEKSCGGFIKPYKG